MTKPLVRVCRATARTHPCPSCGTRGRRTRLLHRRIRSLAYRQVAFLDVHYAEYRSRCSCSSSFRSWPVDVPPKADYDDRVRQAVLDRILDDGLNVERTRAALQRDFLLDLSSGFIYDCLRWQIAQLDLAPYHQLVRDKFSGTLCVDELHLGRFTLLLATDPIADLPVGFALVSKNDQDHLRRFLTNLKNRGVLPKVVVSDGSNLYPTVLAEVWPTARHQLCIFHVLKDVNDLIVAGVRRLARGLQRRGNAGRKRKRGRPSKKQQAARAAAGPTLAEKAGFILANRFLIVKKASDLDEPQKETLDTLFAYLPTLYTLWTFAGAARDLFEKEARVQTLWQRRALLLRTAAYQEVPELEKAMKLLEGKQFKKMVAFVYSPVGQKVRTNNHVERANRWLRFWEKLRYKWRRRRWVVRFVLLALERWWRQAAEAAAQEERTTTAEQKPPPSPCEAAA